jgi:hypothetical protein
VTEGDRSIAGRASRRAEVRGSPPGVRAVGLGLALAALIVGCMASSAPMAPKAKESAMFDPRRQEILNLWTQIRGWRHDAHMDLEPAQAMQFASRGHSVDEAKKVCPDGHKVPSVCGDVCNLGDDICDNAERICTLADELGKDDQEAQEKCTSAKASCREAKQRCCDCSHAEGTP